MLVRFCLWLKRFVLRPLAAILIKCALHICTVILNSPF